MLKDYLLVAGAVAVAVLGNTISAVWAKGDNKFSLWLLAVLIVAPAVYISFGLVTRKAGLAVTSGVIDTSLTVVTILVALIFFGEWNKISFLQYLGLLFALTGLFFMLFFPKQ